MRIGLSTHQGRGSRYTHASAFWVAQFGTSATTEGQLQPPAAPQEQTQPDQSQRVEGAVQKADDWWAEQLRLNGSHKPLSPTVDCDRRRRSPTPEQPKLSKQERRAKHKAEKEAALSDDEAPDADDDSLQDDDEVQSNASLERRQSTPPPKDPTKSLDKVLLKSRMAHTDAMATRADS